MFFLTPYEKNKEKSSWDNEFSLALNHSTRSQYCYSLETPIRPAIIYTQNLPYRQVLVTV